MLKQYEEKEKVENVIAYYYILFHFFRLFSCHTASKLEE